jgi:hypothetical protein
MKKLWTGHKLYLITDYVDFWPPSVTLTLELGDRLLRMTRRLIIVNNYASIYKIPSKIRKLWTGHDIYPQKDNVDLDRASATLTLEVGVWLLRTKHRLIITNICAKLFQIPLINDKVMVRTRKCDGRMDGRALVPIFSGLWAISFVLFWQTCGRTDRRTESISISPFFFAKGGGNKCIII